MEKIIQIIFPIIGNNRYSNRMAIKLQLPNLLSESVGAIIKSLVGGYFGMLALVDDFSRFRKRNKFCFT
ncbi:hypothetical protein OENI_350012 [Oenococcus oeni]|nr:hypothetical protein OENI_350012 [Oenococcus oeni]